MLTAHDIEIFKTDLELAQVLGKNIVTVGREPLLRLIEHIERLSDAPSLEEFNDTNTENERLLAENEDLSSRLASLEDDYRALELEMDELRDARGAA